MSEHGAVALQNVLNDVMRTVRSWRDEARERHLRADPCVVQHVELASLFSRHDTLDKLDAELRNVLKRRLGIDHAEDGDGA